MEIKNYDVFFKVNPRHLTVVYWPKPYSTILLSSASVLDNCGITKPIPARVLHNGGITKPTSIRVLHHRRVSKTSGVISIL